MIRPKGKLPCMLAQATISSAAGSGGARLRSNAPTTATIQPAMMGMTRTCGRTSRVSSLMPKAATVRVRAASRRMRRLNQAKSAVNEPAATSATSATSPRQPAAS